MIYIELFMIYRYLADTCGFMLITNLAAAKCAYCFWMCPSISESVSESVRLENLVNTISKNSEGNFSQFWLPVYLGRCADLSLESKVQRSRSQQAMTRKTG